MASDCYKTEGRGFKTRRDEFFSIYLILRAALRPLEFTQPLIEMSTISRKIFLGSKALPVRRANKLTAISEPIV
jgi:hypothetical protein